MFRVQVYGIIPSHQVMILLNPGWTEEEVSILKLALMRFGVGRWRKIVKSQCLPGKSIGQIYM